jgi:hypothetical protein
MPEAAPCVLPLSETDPSYEQKRAVLRRAGLSFELRAGDTEAGDAALHRWLAAARVCCLDAEELYFLEDDDSLQVQVSPRNEAAALALLLETLRTAGGA